MPLKPLLAKHKPKIVLVFGVFDLLHKGHEYFLAQAKKHGNRLIVVVARDRTVKLTKKQLPINNQNKRLKQIKNFNFVSQARLGNSTPHHNYNLVKLIKPDVLALGYDQKIKINDLKKDLKKIRLSPKIIRLKAYQPQKYKSRLLKAKIKG